MGRTRHASTPLLAIQLYISKVALPDLVRGVSPARLVLCSRIVDRLGLIFPDMSLTNSHYVHVEDFPRIPRCHKNLEGLLRRMIPSLPPDVHTRTRTHAHPHTHAHTYTHTRRHTHAHTHTHTHVRIHARTCTHSRTKKTRTLTHRQAHTYTHEHIRTDTYTHRQTHARKHTQMNTHTHKCTCFPDMSLTISHYVNVEHFTRIPRCHKNLESLLRRMIPSLPPHVHTRTRTHAHPHTRTHTHTHTYTQTQARTHSTAVSIGNEECTQ